MLQAACSVDDYRERARRRLPRPIFDYLEGGAESERTLRRNLDAQRLWGLVPRLAAARHIADTSCTVLGRKLSMPVVLAPTGGLKLFWPDGEIAVARAAASAGVLMAVSAGSSTALPDIVAASPAAEWFQICVYRDRGLQRDLIAAARDAACAGLCVTLDAGVLGKRERDVRNRLDYSSSFARRHVLELLRHPRWTWQMRSAMPLQFPHLPPPSEGASASWFSSLFEPCPTWQDLEEIRAEWSGRLILKAILNPEDAARAVAIGADAIVISNHGGRQFDSGVGTLDRLPEIAAATKGAAAVLLDGGIRRGTDVLRALALGATACMLGRAHLYGLAAAGEQGVRHVLEILREEIQRALQFCGVASPAGVGRQHVVQLTEIP